MQPSYIGRRRSAINSRLVNRRNTPGTRVPEVAAGPPTLIVGVHLVLVKDGRVLLGRQRNTSYAENHWHTPAGHMEPPESELRATAREAE